MKSKTPQESLEDSAAAKARRFAAEFASGARLARGSAAPFAASSEGADDVLGRLGPLVYDATVAGGLLGAAESLSPLAGSGRGGFPQDPHSLLYQGSSGPAYDFPVVRRSIKAIETAVSLSPESYYSLSAEARRRSFSITANLKTATIEKVRSLLTETMKGKQSRTDFESVVRRELPGVLSPDHLEQVFRNNVNGAYSDGAETALRDRAVVDAFPFRAYYSIRDDRARPEHRRMERLGLNGSNVYAANDPVWAMFRPPWDWNCRCGFTPLTIKQAARKGVLVAVEWLDTGVQPANLFVPWPPFLPSASWRRL